MPSMREEAALSERRRFVASVLSDAVRDVSAWSWVRALDASEIAATLSSPKLNRRFPILPGTKTR
jgi:hypothetical protein